MSRSQSSFGRLFIVVALALVAVTAFFYTRQQGLIPVTGKVGGASMAANSRKSIDLSGGYTLEIVDSRSKVDVPAAKIKVEPASSQVQSIDLGSGYWLKMDGTQAEIVKEGSR